MGSTRGLRLVFVADGHIPKRVLARYLSLSFFLYAGDPFRLELVCRRCKDEAPFSIVPIFLTIVPQHRILAIVVLLTKLLLDDRCPNKSVH